MSQPDKPQQQEPSNDQDPTQQKAATMIKSAITLDELLEILNEVDCDYELHERPEDLFCYIECDLYDAIFLIFPIGPGPFYQEMKLEAIRCPELDPETMCTEFNKIHSFATAAPIDLNESDDDEATTDIVIAIKKLVSFDGGVTDGFIKKTIELWGGMLLSTEGFFEGPVVEVEDE